MKKKNKKRIRNLLIILIIVFGLYFLFEYDIDININQRPDDTTTTEITTETSSDQLSVVIIDKLTMANVYIQVNYQDGYEFGSGVIIHEDATHYYALTNYHVIDGNGHVINSYEVKTHDQVTSSFEIVKVDESLDLVLIKLEKENRDTNVIPLAITNTYNDNDIVASVGNPLGNFGQVTYGFILDITTLQELELTYQVIEHNATLFNGSSGGALVNGQGELIGINTWKLNGMYYAIRASVINDFLINII
jgi:serine protease Do